MTELLEKEKEFLNTKWIKVQDGKRNTRKGYSDFLGGIAYTGIGHSESLNAVNDALKEAFVSPLLDGVSLADAKGLIIHFEVPSRYADIEISKAMKSAEEYIAKDTLVVFSITENNKLGTEEVNVTIITTGFYDDQDYNIQQIQKIALSA